MRPFSSDNPIFLIGFMGAGKTTLGKELALRLKREFFDTDLLLEDRFQKSILQMFDYEGEPVFRQRETEIIRELCGLGPVVVATGGGLACHSGNMSLMIRSGTTIYLHLGVRTLVERLSKDMQKRPLLQELETEDLNCYVAMTLQKREKYYTQADIILDFERLSPDDDPVKVLENLLKSPNETTSTLDNPQKF